MSAPPDRARGGRRFGPLAADRQTRRVALSIREVGMMPARVVEVENTPGPNALACGPHQFRQRDEIDEQLADPRGVVGPAFGVSMGEQDIGAASIQDAFDPQGSSGDGAEDGGRFLADGLVTCDHVAEHAFMALLWFLEASGYAPPGPAARAVAAGGRADAARGAKRPSSPRPIRRSANAVSAIPRQSPAGAANRRMRGAMPVANPKNQYQGAAVVDMHQGGSQQSDIAS